MIATRFRQIALLLLAVAISALAFIQMFQRTTGAFPVQYAIMSIRARDGISPSARSYGCTLLWCFRR